MHLQLESKEPFCLQAKETIRVNYFGTRSVCEELFPLLRPGARVVNVSSSSGGFPKLGYRYWVTLINCTTKYICLLGHLSAIHGQEPQASTLREQFCNPSLTLTQLDELMNSFVR